MRSNSRNYQPEPEPWRRGVILAGDGVAAFGFVRNSVAELADSAATLPAFSSADFNGRMSLLNVWASWRP